MPFVAPEARGGAVLKVTLGVELLGEKVIGKFAPLGEAVRTLRTGGGCIW